MIQKIDVLKMVEDELNGMFDCTIYDRSLWGFSFDITDSLKKHKNLCVTYTKESDDFGGRLICLWDADDKLLGEVFDDCYRDRLTQMLYDGINKVIK